MAHVRATVALVVLVAIGVASPALAAAAPAPHPPRSGFAPVVSAARGVTDGAGTTIAVVGETTQRTIVARYAQALAAEQLARQAAFRSFVAAAAAADAALWDRMARCETGGNWRMHGARYSGGVGFANSTWSAFGGDQFAANAGDATRAQQIVIADRVRDAVGYGAWGCAPAVGL